MTNRLSPVASRDPEQKRHSLLSARKAALMASAVAALVMCGISLSPDHLPMLGSSAYAGVNNAGAGAAQPVGFADTVERVKPSVISVKVTMKDKTTNAKATNEDESDSPMERFFRQFGGPNGGPQNPGGKGRDGEKMGQGSGFFISSDGYAVTNNHVVEGAEKVEVTTDGGKTYAAKVIGTDPRTDLALIKIEGSDFPFTKLSEGKARVGDWVLAVGNPFGLGGTVTAGIVSASGRDIGSGPYDDFIQIDAPVNKGNSGGPAFNMQGEVVGVNTAIYSPSGGSVGIAFSIPAATVKSVIAQLKDKGSVTRGWIGVQIQPVTQEIADSMGLKKAEGALIADPQKDGPAAKAGLVSGDVITAANGQPVKDARELARIIGGFAPGSTAKLDVLHKGRQKVVSLTLGELPNAQQAKIDAEAAGKGSTHGTDVPRLGLSVAPAGKMDGAGKEGVVITKVEPKSAAADRGIKKGDVILEVAGKNVSNPGDIGEALDAARADKKSSVLMRLRSGEASHYVAVPVANG
ncbi:Do family serine endopeptidase [Bradyrhizobium sp. LjRoot220]|uniref:Do family serine endopeptidase n=1 Tax=Bradyrhizobium sp. LjRoot220 TaxID=3342284 RepID=UPI003ECC6DAF